MSMDDGKEGKVGNEIPDSDAKHHIHRMSNASRDLHNESLRSRNEGQADLRGTETPLLVHGLEGFEESEDKGVAESTE